MKAARAAFICGTVFAIGLGLSGMTNPARVIGFLDFAGHWDPALLFVMGGAVVTYAIGYRLVLRLKQPVLAPSFSIPPRRAVDLRLIIGSILFGVGWGLCGYCPAPAIVSVAAGSMDAAIFTVAMLGGMILVRQVSMVLDAKRPVSKLATENTAISTG